MKYKKSFLYLGICSILLFGIVQIVFGSTLSAFQGGTGIATSTPSNDGFCLQQVSSTPFLTWTEGACASGSPGTSTITAQGVTITGPGFTFATSGPMLSITVSGQTVTFTNSSSSLNLQNLVPNTRAINTTSPWLTGGGDLSADRTLNFVNQGFVTAASSVVWTATQQFASVSSTQTISASTTLNGTTLHNGTSTFMAQAIHNATSTFNSSTILIGVVSSTEKSALILAAADGTWGAYGGASACSAGNAITTISAVGGTTCAAFLTLATSSPFLSTGIVFNNGGALSASTTSTITSDGHISSTLPIYINNDKVSTSTPGIYMGYTSAGLLTVSSTVVSSTINLTITAPTTTAPAYTMTVWDYQRLFTQIGCVDAVGTTTLQIWNTTGITTTTVNASVIGQGSITSTLACGINGNNTTTFTSSTLRANYALVVNVTSTAVVGTTDTVRIWMTSTKQ